MNISYPLETAKSQKNDIELIVIGTFGKTGVQRFLLESVAENVLDILKHQYSW